ncbi:pilus assembly protein [Marinomonas sp. TI.3.20]|uniref:TadE/TadG family type IV pilus assembly protein n=1 Tax=Marinomonas sp. TI.3.20 TaxID=3121296 RepID=UPI00311E48E7
MTTLNHKESGNAALIFVMMFPFLIGMFILGTDGARALQDKARLEDASEVATLTVAAQNSDDKGVQQATAKKIVQAYFPNATVGKIDLTKLACEENSNCSTTTGQRFFEYRLTSVTISEDSWLYSNDSSIASMGKSFDIKGSSIARKYQSQAVDVVLVSDFSGSMGNTWTGGSTKYKDLENIIVEIATELKKFNNLNTDGKVNKLAVVGFNSYTTDSSSSTREISSNLICNDRCSLDNPGKQYLANKKDYRKNGVGLKSCKDYYDYFYYGYSYSYNHGDYYYYDKDRRYYYNNNFRFKYCENTGEINVSETIDNIFTTDGSLAAYPNNKKNSIASWKWPKFGTILLSDPSSDKFEITSLNGSFKPGGYTASYTGLIRGAQVADSGTNPRRIIIILSDGVDEPNGGITSLLKDKLCTTIVNHLESKSINGIKVKAKLAIVGFDYPVGGNAMSQCVSKTGGEVYQAQNTNEIKNKILELITEEIGHSAL